MEKERLNYLEDLANVLSDYDGIQVEHLEELLQMFEDYDVFDFDLYMRDFRSIRLVDLEDVEFVLEKVKVNLAQLIKDSYVEILEDVKNEKLGNELYI